jgi:hypothetical protein
VPPAEFLLILNKNGNIVPGVARLNREHPAAYVGGGPGAA